MRAMSREVASESVVESVVEGSGGSLKGVVSPRRWRSRRRLVAMRKR